MKKLLIAITAVSAIAIQAQAIPRAPMTKAEQILNASKERLADSKEESIVASNTPAKVAPTKAETVLKASQEERSATVKTALDTRTKTEKALQR